MKGFLFQIVKFFPTYKIYAHCDIPCGIYDPKPAQIAAATILKMDQLIEALQLPDQNNKQGMISYYNSMTRHVLIKEEHARKCKEEILVLWTDYFKPEHLEKFPNLHDIFWNTAKLCSKNKQEVNIKTAEELIKAVDQIADIFYKTKSSPKK